MKAEGARGGKGKGDGRAGTAAGSSATRVQRQWESSECGNGENPWLGASARKGMSGIPTQVMNTGEGSYYRGSTNTQTNNMP